MVFCERGVSGNLSKPLKNTFQWVNYFSKVAVYRTAALLKMNFSTGKWTGWYTR